MPDAVTHPGAPHPTPPHAVAPGEPLAVARAGAFRLLVPLRYVARVHPAALPAPRPALGAAPPVVALDGAPWPVVFAAGLLGEPEVALEARAQMLALEDGPRRALLWVDAVEDVAEHAPAPPPAGAGPAGTLVACHSGPRALAVLDVPALLALAAPPPGEDAA